MSSHNCSQEKNKNCHCSYQGGKQVSFYILNKITYNIKYSNFRAVSCVISTVFFPIFSWVLFIATIGFAVSVGLYLASIGEPTFKMIKPLDSNGKVPNEMCSCEGPASSYVLGSKCDPEIFQKNCFILNADVTIRDFFRQRVPCSRTGCYFEKIQNPQLVSYFLVKSLFIC